jgi:hypothetical protein
MAARRKPRRSLETPLAASIRRLATNYMANGQRDWAHGMMFAADKVDDAHAEGAAGQLKVAALLGHLKTAHDLLTKASAVIKLAAESAAGRPSPHLVRVGIAPSKPSPSVPSIPKAAAPRKVTATPPAASGVASGKPELSKLEGLVLAALRTLHPQAVSRRMLGLMTIYRYDTGNFGNVLSALRGGGLISGQGHMPITLTPFGLEVAPSDPMPTGLDVCQAWLQSGKLSKVAHEILTAMVCAPGNGFPSREACAAATASGYRGDTGNFGNGLSELRGNGLVDRLSIWRGLLHE